MDDEQIAKSAFLKNEKGFDTKQCKNEEDAKSKIG